MLGAIPLRAIRQNVPRIGVRTTDPVAQAFCLLSFYLITSIFADRTSWALSRQERRSAVRSD